MATNRNSTNPEHAVNRLTRKDMRRVEDWLQSKWPNYENAFTNFQSIAATASAELDLVVSEANVRGAYHALDLKILTRRRVSTRSGSPGKRKLAARLGREAVRRVGLSRSAHAK